MLAIIPAALVVPALTALALVAALCCASIAWDVIHYRERRIEVRQRGPSAVAATGSWSLRQLDGQPVRQAVDPASLVSRKAASVGLPGFVTARKVRIPSLEFRSTWARQVLTRENIGSWAHAQPPTPKHSYRSERIKQGHVPTSCESPVVMLS